MLLMYNYVLLKMSTWYSKHVEESNNIWRINNIHCITLVVLYGRFVYLWRVWTSCANAAHCTPVVGDADAVRWHSALLSLARSFKKTKESEIWKIKTKEELDKLMKHKNIVSYIKAQRLSWFGHVQRMPHTRTVKKMFKWKPLTKRSQGRPKYRWENNIKQDICQMRIKNWIACVQDRGKWKDVVEKGKTFNH